MLHYRLLCLDSNVSPEGPGVESNLLRIIHAGVKSGNLWIPLHLEGHTHTFDPRCCRRITVTRL